MKLIPEQSTKWLEGTNKEGIYGKNILESEVDTTKTKARLFARSKELLGEPCAEVEEGMVDGSVRSEHKEAQSCRTI